MARHDEYFIKSLENIYNFVPIGDPNTRDKYVKINRNSFVIGTNFTKNEIENYNPGTFFDAVNGYNYIRYFDKFAEGKHKAMNRAFSLLKDPKYTENVQFVVDHINGNKTDNHYRNLRLIPQSLNRMNVATKILPNLPKEVTKRLLRIETNFGSITNLLPDIFYQIEHRVSDKTNKPICNVCHIYIRIHPYNGDFRVAHAAIKAKRDGSFNFPQYCFYDDQCHNGFIPEVIPEVIP